MKHEEQVSCALNKKDNFQCNFQISLEKSIFDTTPSNEELLESFLGCLTDINKCLFKYVITIFMVKISMNPLAVFLILIWKFIPFLSPDVGFRSKVRWNLWYVILKTDFYEKGKQPIKKFWISSCLRLYVEDRVSNSWSSLVIHEGVLFGEVSHVFLLTTVIIIGKKITDKSFPHFVQLLIHVA